MACQFDKLLFESEQRFSKALIDIDYKVLMSLTHPNAVFTTESAEIFHGIISLYQYYSSIIKIQSIELLHRNVQFHKNYAVVSSIERRLGLLNEIDVQSEYAITRVWKCLPTKCIVISGSIVNRRNALR
jgi:hypothetical protein